MQYSHHSKLNYDRPAKRPKNINDYGDHFDEHRGTQISKMVAKFMLGFALLFTITGSVLFIEMISTLNKACIL